MLGRLKWREAQARRPIVNKTKAAAGLRVFYHTCEMNMQFSLFLFFKKRIK